MMIGLPTKSITKQEDKQTQQVWHIQAEERQQQCLWFAPRIGVSSDRSASVANDCLGASYGRFHATRVSGIQLITANGDTAGGGGVYKLPARPAVAAATE
jgi:hypothetical protein